MDSKSIKRIVVIGGGFAGVNLVKQLLNCKSFAITLVDKNNYNFFAPLIYQVATGFLETSNISYPFRKLFSENKNFSFRMGELIKVIPEENKIVLSSGELEYDYLVFATGTETNYFGMENVKENALPMKTLNDALQMRNTLLERLELASITEDPIERKKLLTIVVTGGGPTGVEISGMFAEMRNSIIRKEYPELIGASGDIYLIDGGEELLSPMSKKSQEYTYNSLIEAGVKIKLNTHVKDYTNDIVIFSHGDSIPTKNLIWAAGVTSKVFEGIPTSCYGRGKRILVNEFNRSITFENIYALGDTCLQTTDPNYPEGHPQVAQVAKQQAVNLGKNLKRNLKSDNLKPFAYHDKGSMAIIGRNKAVADIPKPNLHFNGFIAWFAWLFVHLLSLINYRNRIKTLYNWTVAYLTKDQSLRMIIRPMKKT